MDVLKAWDYAETICYSDKLQISYIKAEKDARKHIFDISKVRKSSRRGLLGRQNCILGWNSVPLGLFLRKTCPRMSKKRPGGAKLGLVVFYIVFNRRYSSKWDPEGIPEVSWASKMSLKASQQHPKGVQERQRSVQEAKSSI